MEDSLVKQIFKILSFIVILICLYYVWIATKQYDLLLEIGLSVVPTYSQIWPMVIAQAVLFYVAKLILLQLLIPLI